MNRIKNTLKALAALFLLVLFVLLALPEISFNAFDQSIRFSPADDLFKPQKISISDFKKGEGLYSSQTVSAEFPANTTEEAVNKTFDLVKNRINIAQLGDIKITLDLKESRYYLNFEYPNYYIDPTQYTTWLTANGDIYFITSGENPQILDLNDYDIDGEIKSDYSTLNEDHLSFYFNESKAAILTSVLDTGNQFFTMNVDGNSTFYILNFDQYTDTNLNRVRAISTLGFAGSEGRTVKDYTNIVRSYFSSGKIEQSLTVLEGVGEVLPAAKPTSLRYIALGSIFISIVPLIVLSIIKRTDKSLILKNVIWISITAVFFVGLLKFAGAILDINLVLTYFGVILISQLLIINWNSILLPRRIVLALILVSAFITKLYFLNFALGSIGAIMVIGLISLLIGSYYNELIQTFSIPTLKFRKRK